MKLLTCGATLLSVLALHLSCSTDSSTSDTPVEPVAAQDIDAVALAHENTSLRQSLGEKDGAIAQRDQLLQQKEAAIAQLTSQLEATKTVEDRKALLPHINFMASELEKEIATLKEQIQQSQVQLEQANQQESEELMRMKERHDRITATDLPGEEKIIKIAEEELARLKDRDAPKTEIDSQVAVLNNHKAKVQSLLEEKNRLAETILTWELARNGKVTANENPNIPPRFEAVKNLQASILTMQDKLVNRERALSSAKKLKATAAEMDNLIAK